MSVIGTQRAQASRPRLAAAGVFAVSLALYLCSMPRQVGLEDAGLFGLVCTHFGLAHAPGYPLYSLACPAFAHLPGVDPVVGLGLFSALAGAATVSLLALWLQRLLAAPAAVAAALAYGVSLSFWSQAIIPEVYALNSALTLATLVVLDRMRARDDAAPPLPLLGLLAGLGLANHWPLFLASGPAFLLLVAPRLPALLRALAQPRTLARTFGALAVGLAPYAFLVYRLFMPASISMLPAASGFADVLRYLERNQYAGIDKSQWALPTDEISWLGWLLAELARQFTPYLLPWLAIGLLACLRRAPWLAAGLCGLLACHTLAIALVLDFPFDYAWQSVFRPYSLVAWMALAVFLGFGIDVTLSWLQGRFGGWLAPLFAAAAPLLVAIANLPYNDRHGQNLAVVQAEVVLESLPAGAVLVIGGDPDLPLAYLHDRGLAPDVELMQRNGLILPNRLFPPTTPPSAQQARWRRFIDTEKRPVYFTHWEPMDRALSLHGLLYQMHPQGHQGYQGCTALPRQDAFVAELLRLQPLHPAEQMLRNDTLMAAALCLTARAPDDPPAAVLLHAVQQDPTGALASLAWLLTQPPTPLRDGELTRLAAIAAGASFEAFSNKQRALRETLLGKVAMRTEAAPFDSARKHFERAIALRDPPANGAPKALAELFTRSGQSVALDDLLQRFPGLSDLDRYRK